MTYYEDKGKTEWKEIPLTQGKVTLVDKNKYDELMKMKWYYAKDKRRGDEGYAASRGLNRKGRSVPIIRMHRYLLGLKAGDGQLADHINGDGLDNRLSNLRLVNRYQNVTNSKLSKRNTTGYRGVVRSRHNGYIASIRVNTKLIHLGTFKTAQEAAKVYDEASLKYHKEYGRRNFKK